MVHDRRIDGQTYTFGNAGGLFMNAMTWYDHKTESIWSQPWGRAIIGDLKNVQLFLLPSQVITWQKWQENHPETLVLVNDIDQVKRRQGFNPDFVIGLILNDHAKAFYYSDVAQTVIVNDYLGEVPIFIWAADNSYQAYIRQVGDQVLTFRQEETLVVDEETGSTWNLARGLATAGPLSGQGLQPVPSLTAKDSAWRDFYPETTFYEP